MCECGTGSTFIYTCISIIFSLAVHVCRCEEMRLILGVCLLLLSLCEFLFSASNFFFVFLSQHLPDIAFPFAMFFFRRAVQRSRVGRQFAEGFLCSRLTQTKSVIVIVSSYMLDSVLVRWWERRSQRKVLSLVKTQVWSSTGDYAWKSKSFHKVK